MSKRFPLRSMLCILTLACDTPTGPGIEGERPDVRTWVTGDAAEYLDSRGHFLLPLPQGDSRSISPEIAREQAQAFFTSFAFPDVVIGQSFGQRLTAEHGQFDPGRVRVSPVVYYAESGYEPLQDSVPAYVQKWLGPRFVNYFSLDGNIIGTLAASALNTDLWIEGGQIRRPAIHGGEWRWTVVPREYSFSYPISPERAVEYVGQLFGLKISRIPRLLLPHRIYAASFARWEIGLEKPVTVVGDSTGRTYTTTTVYVGAGRYGPEAIWVSLPDQPVEDVIPYPLPMSDEVRELTVRITDPVLFEIASPPT